MKMNENKEMYLVHIARESEGSSDPVPLRRLAEHLDILPASVNQMVKKMEASGKVSYTPYQGVLLTDEGRKEALHILRKRRLWEVFLTQHLKFDPQEANEIACEYEHVTADDVTERLAEFLGHPQITSTGKTIPDSESQANVPLGSPLSMITAGKVVKVLRVQVDEPKRAFLKESGVIPGNLLNVLAIQADGKCLVQPKDFPLVQLSSRLSHWIKVLPVKEA